MVLITQSTYSAMLLSDRLTRLDKNARVLGFLEKIVTVQKNSRFAELLLEAYSQIEVLDYLYMNTVIERITSLVHELIEASCSKKNSVNRISASLSEALNGSSANKLMRSFMKEEEYPAEISAINQLRNLSNQIDLALKSQDSDQNTVSSPDEEPLTKRRRIASQDSDSGISTEDGNLKFVDELLKEYGASSADFAEDAAGFLSPEEFAEVQAAIFTYLES